MRPSQCFYCGIILGLTVANAQLQRTGPSHGVSLLQYGSAIATLDFHLETNRPLREQSVTMTTSNSDIVTSHEVSISKISETSFNISVILLFRRFPGRISYKLSMGTGYGRFAERHVVDGTHDVLGFVLFEEVDGRRVVRSGNENVLTFSGYMHPGDEGRTLDIVSYPEMSTEEIDVMHIRAQKPLFDKATPVQLENVNIRNGRVNVRPSDYFVSNTSTFFVLEAPSIVHAGEVSKSDLTIILCHTCIPPPVVLSGDSAAVLLNFQNGSHSFELHMFNIPNDVLSISTIANGLVFSAVSWKAASTTAVRRVRFQGKKDQESSAKQWQSEDLEVRVKDATGETQLAKHTGKVVRLYRSNSNGESRKKPLTMVWIFLCVIGGLLLFAILVFLGMRLWPKSEYYPFTIPETVRSSPSGPETDYYGRGSIVTPSPQQI